MTKSEQAVQFHNHPTIHYNCGQSVLLAFAPECGLTQEQAVAAAAHFGGGMGSGGTCGALAGALLTLGLLGAPKEAARALTAQFRTAKGDTLCAPLLATGRDTGLDRHTHCDGMVRECAALVEAYLRQR